MTVAGLAASAAAAGIPLGQAAANIATTLRGLDDDTLPDTDIAKAVAEQRFVLGVAYQAGKDSRIAKGVDGGRDFFTEAELEKAAWSFLQNGPRVGAFHVDGTDQNGGQATIVESYIYRNPVPWVVDDDLVVRKGDWVVGGILDDRAWQLHKAGKINGWSPQGTAKRRRPVAKAADRSTAQLAVTGSDDQLASFLQLCKTIQWLCSAGASRTVQIDVDGDGSGALRFDFGDLDLPDVDESQMDSDVVRVPGIGG